MSENESERVWGDVVNRLVGWSTEPEKVKKKIENLEEASNAAQQLLEEFEKIGSRSNELEDMFGKEQAYIWSWAQLTTLSASQLRAVRWCLFDQRRALLGDPGDFKRILEDYKNVTGKALSLEIKRRSSIKDAVADSDRVQNATRYLEVAREVLALGVTGSQAKAMFDNECHHEGLSVLSDTQRRHYFRTARRVD
jgi:hypothetical protein